MRFIDGALATALSIGTMLSTPLTINAVPANPGISITQRDGNVSVKACVESARQALRTLKFQDIKVTESYVEGNLADYSALVTCYKVVSAQGVVVQGIVIAGPSSTQAKNISEQLIGAMR
jgi:hypothetical protein